MQQAYPNLDKGKQRARDPEAAANEQTSCEDMGAGPSNVHEPMDISARGPISQNDEQDPSDQSRNPSKFRDSGDNDRRPSHTRAASSLGSSNMFDFFGPSSMASNMTTATSFNFGSPGASPKPELATQVADPATIEQRSSLEETIDANVARFPAVEPAAAAASVQEHTADTVLVASSSDQSPNEADAAEAHLGVPSAPMPPLYPEETLPSYEEAPEYTPPLEQQSGRNSRTKAFRAAVANRFLSSRIAKKLNLPPALQSRLQGNQTPGSSSGSRPNVQENMALFGRSDSAPNLARSTQTIGRRRIEVRNYAATAFVDGARMGPAPRQIRPSSSHRSIARDSARPNPASNVRPSTSTGVTSRSVGASPLLRTAVASTSSSRRNSGESRPPSRATISSAPNGGLFTCGYTSSNRSGASTPMRPGLLRSGRSRTVSLKSIGDLLIRHRDRDRRPDTPGDEDSQPSNHEESTGSSASRIISREVVSPVSQEVLISARVHTSSTARPALMNAVHSSPQAGIDAASAVSPVLISPHERRLNPLQKLPRELILTIFKSLVGIHIREHDKAMEDGVWRGKKSNETRWCGAEAAVRELARLSRVSRTWQSYVLDGQLWRDMDFSSYPDIAEDAMIRIAKSAGPFVRRLDLHGLAGLRSSVLLALSRAQQPRPLTTWEMQTTASPCVSVASRQLEELNLEGCRQISNSALNNVLSQCPNLKVCKLGSLPCVDNTTLCVLAATAANLEVLDISRCSGVDGHGIRTIFAVQESEINASAVLKERNVASKFRELHASGVQGFDSDTLNQLGRHWPNLEVLDASYCRDINDAAIAALVSSDGDVINEKSNHVTLSPRQAGIQQDDGVVRRKFPHLRKLKLSSCRALTDRACISLAHAVPKLEVLEMANIGPGIKDTGLVKLLATVPQLQKLDLERATNITDAVLTALTPPESHSEAFGLAVPDREILMHGARPRGSLLTLARRSVSRRRQANESTSAVQDEAPPSYDAEAVAALIPATGTHLTHLILSSANHLTAEAMLLLVNRCPFLVHLEVDDTHADNDVATQFVQLARYRKVRNAYLSLVDCRSFSRDTYSQLSHADAVDGGVRPRRGSRGYAFRHFNYDDPEVHVTGSESNTGSPHIGSHSQDGPQSSPTIPSSSERSSIEVRRIDRNHDECNELKPVVKSFWGWQLVDARMKQKRRAEQRAASQKQKTRHRMSDVVAMALGISAGGDEDGSTAMGSLRGGGPRWSRVLVERDRVEEAGVAAEDDEYDARGCIVM